MTWSDVLFWVLVAFAVVLCIWSGIKWVAEKEEPIPSPVYQVLQADAPINEEQLSDMRERGWHLITIVPVGILFYFYFERRP